MLFRLEERRRETNNIESLEQERIMWFCNKRTNDSAEEANSRADNQEILRFLRNTGFVTVLTKAHHCTPS
jgi:CMP-2-keto-3-deoxyoctulosonic acid synthetase